MTVKGGTCRVDAAHIIPVEVGGNNQTHNGLSLCKLHHGAYDRGLVGIFPDYRVTVNQTETERLRRANLLGGIQNFRARLLPELRLPRRAQDRANPDYLQRGLALRGWTGVLAPARR